ncbi:gamma-aminobutyric acid receptor subunit beta-like isoform X14 [Dinothrombium tinctorium]|uniref:Gamma-aminobutyric acid receptor subunit beta-like isoform X14 n=1 Tax=Dinothrombium tinctorium TaxID=1965070 RepID=A0A443QEM2_9ACAR|nr:gamma-aminobutyric acid receptor subunit beta-like isoform X14 [Dinothrombium tinctorium]
MECLPLKSKPLYIFHFSEYSAKSHTFEIDVYIRYRWNDSRLIFKPEGIKTICNGYEIAKNIWVPQVLFLRESGNHRRRDGVFPSNAFIEINNTGEVSYGQTHTTTAYCEIGLGYYPMDRHNCIVEIESNIGSATSIDVYVVACLLLVTSAFYLSIKSIDQSEASVEKRQNFETEAVSKNRLFGQNVANKTIVRIFAFIFIFFNLVYWLTCLIGPILQATFL